MTIHCRVIVFLSPDTLRDLVTLTFDLLNLNSWRTWLVTWPTLQPSLKTLCLFVLELWVISFPVGYLWKYVRGHCACVESRDPWVAARKRLHFWNPRPRFAYSLLLGTTTINGHFLWSFINAKAFDCVIFLCVTLWPLRLTLNSCRTWWVRSWVTSYIGSHWLPLKMRTRPLPMYRITRTVRRGSKIITFLKSPTPICLFTIQLLLGYDDD